MVLEQTERFCRLGLAVIETEQQSVLALKDRINHSFAQACQQLLNCSGRVVVIGMGKSGHIGGKIAATLASTGTPAFFVHPGEANHGDLGMITRQDVVIALSNSGETAEILSLLPLIKRLAIPLIALTGNPHSTLAVTSDVNLDVSVEREACPLNLAPTSSTTVALVMGDALAVALLEARGFTAEDFALSHPGGSLGRRLLIKVQDLMHTGNDLPRVLPNASIREALFEMTRTAMIGMVAVVNQQDQLIGLFTDGDLRRSLDKQLDLNNTTINQVMTLKPRTIAPGLLAAQALELMERHKINGLLVVDSNDKLLGAINMHDLLKAKVV